MSDLPLPCSAVWLPCQARWAGATCSPQGAGAGERTSSPAARCCPSWCCSPSRPTRTASSAGTRGPQARVPRDCFAALPRCSPFVSLLPHLLLPLYRLPPCGGQKTGIYLPNQAGPLPQCSHEPQQGLPRAGRRGPPWGLGLQAPSGHQPQGARQGLQDHRRPERAPTA